MTLKEPPLDLLAQGPWLNLLAAIEVSDIDEAHRTVHGVFARTLHGFVSTTLAGLDADLAYALHPRVGRTAPGALT